MAGKAKKFAGLVLILYGIVMAYLLFLQRQPANLDYWTYVKSSYNLRPLHTIRQMTGLLHHERLFWFAAANLAGNIVMFLPLGLLPVVWQRQSRFWVYLLTVGGLILAVELLQLFTTLGAADIDDWIFNVLGAILGFGLWKLLAGREKTE